MLEKDTYWSIVNINSETIEDFVKAIVPECQLIKDSPEEIRRSFKTIKNILICSYYDRGMIDVAINRTLHVFELALKLMKKEITGKNSDETLFPLINWFSTKGYFEKSKVDHLRQIRNLLTHENMIAGELLMNVYRYVIDLINDLYKDSDSK